MGRLPEPSGVAFRHTGPFTACLAGTAMLFILHACIPSFVSAQSRRNYWVWFADKGPRVPKSGALAKGGAAYSVAAESLTPRALARRSRALRQEPLVDAEDLPISEPYIGAVEAAGGILRQRSRWLNAASFSLTADQKLRVAELAGVVKLTPVVTLHARPGAENAAPEGEPSLARTTSLDYGPSATQIQQINVTSLHDLGINGLGVLVGMLDSGFRWRAHESLQTRDVIAEYDFIHHDDNTANEANDSANQDEHGTLTFSTLGGWAPGSLIGPAYNAEFILAKTEWVPVTDYQSEEDNWVAGIEWEESYGVDVVSSSLGYNTFVDTTDYTWEHGDFNGRTTASALAAERAARLGVVVCTAMGNESNGDGVTGTLLTPADADSIISVGNISLQRHLSFTSSTGPTNDGRIKPDLVAPGVGIYCADVYGSDLYWTKSGTSLSTPLTAGAAALLLSVRPELTPMDVITALKNTADRNLADPFDNSYHVYPNNFVGWGAVNAFQAALFFGPIFSNQPAIRMRGDTMDILTDVVSKYGLKSDSVLFFYATGTSQQFTPIAMQLDSSMFYSSSGRYVVRVPQSPAGTEFHFYIEARDAAGHSYRSPAAVRDTLWTFRYGEPTIDPGLPGQYALIQNYPNPFNPTTTITTVPFFTQHPAVVDISIYNILGQRVRTVFQGTSFPQQNSVTWDGKDERGRTAASGMYFCRMKTPVSVFGIKIVLVR